MKDGWREREREEEKEESREEGGVERAEGLDFGSEATPGKILLSP